MAAERSSSITVPRLVGDDYLGTRVAAKVIVANHTLKSRPQSYQVLMAGIQRLAAQVRPPVMLAGKG